ncbi:hypothetical protein B0T10DRAFT_596660 [Thelonectria olida]|uniref:DUF6546 domain-containing protein n=1 Tax=Thelonectria olida TaxID=1576542 RepID=A0A9P8W954_9HYPO|nr:hypothetical protein B0T10DRAFT_596660 [Thelonectria olida]
MFFSILPCELQLTIFEILCATTVRLPRGTGANHLVHPSSAYASVNTTWQRFFEKHNFKHIILQQYDIDDFRTVVHDKGHRRRLVEWIWLRLELPQYGCHLCEEPESDKEELQNNIIFTDMVWTLFDLLATWRKMSGFRVDKGTLTLELSAHSPSDSQHWWKELQGRINDTPWKAHSLPRSRISDRAHGWRKGRQLLAPGRGAIMRAHGHPQGLQFDHNAPSARQMRKLPKVSVVGRLVIRRQFYRNISVPWALKPIIESLTHLTDLRYETWRGIDSEVAPGRAIRDAQRIQLFRDVFKYRRSLRRVSIFEDFDSIVYPADVSIQPVDPELGQALAKASRGFEEVHAALNIDAADFFSPILDHRPRGGVEWLRLKHLSLTSLEMGPIGYRLLIHRAAEAAKVMPVLELMELWNGQQEWAGIFRFQVEGDQAMIQLLTTFTANFLPVTSRIWREVAAERGCRHELKMRLGTLDATVDDFVSVLPLLKFKKRILMDTSLHQLLTFWGIKDA